MKKIAVFILIIITIMYGCVNNSAPVYKGLPDDLLHSKTNVIGTDTIIYHLVHTDQNGNILPWFSSNPGESYDQALKLVWSFWNKMELDSNGIKYYLNHQVWKKNHDMRGLGGDQFQMALSSWDLLYNYTGDESVLENMKFLADYYLAHSLSKPDCLWPDLPYPYNMVIHSGEYDGDMILGKDILQPDKAGSFGYELVHLYKKTGNERYLDAAVKIANTLAAKVQPGDGDHSPWPFKVNAITGESGIITDIDSWHIGMDADIKKTAANAKKSEYTSNWTGSLNMFTELIALQKGNTDAYKNALDLTINWLKTYPAKNNKWGPFFEDVPKWSDTQINAITYAMYIMEHPELDSNWKETVNSIFKWVYNELGNEEYKKYGVICINEQTAYRVPGNSHSSRQSSMELAYWEKTGDTTYVRNAVRMLNWATYMVDIDGKNFYPRDNVWMTDGYGDYVRHYLRAMAAAPQLAPDDKDHLLRTSSIISSIQYGTISIKYKTFDNQSAELFRLTSKPQKIQVNDQLLAEVNDINIEGWVWIPLNSGGILKINQSIGNKIEIIK